MFKLAVLMLIFQMASCLNYQGTKSNQIETSKSEKHTPVHEDPKTEKTTSGGNNLARQILGIWAGKNDLNATFEINKDNIYYPDQSSGYIYYIAKDLLVIDYKAYRDTFKIETKGNDTLILSNKSEERQVFHRFKK